MTQVTRLAVGAVLMLAAIGAVAQNTSIQLFQPVVVQTSPNNTLQSVGTKTVILSCPVTGISAVVSQSPTTNAPVFADNFIGLTLNPPTGQTVPTNQSNICTDPTGNSDVQGQGTGGQYANTFDCFNAAYSGSGVAGSYLNQNPDTATSTFGSLLVNYAVTPPDISHALSGALLFPINAPASLSRGTVTARFDLMDFGGLFGASSLYLNGNCAQTTGQPQILNINPNGNPGFDVANFSSGGHTYTYKVGNYGANGGATVAVTDLQLSQADFQAMLATAPGGSNFAGAQCIRYASAANECEVFNVECIPSPSDTTNVCSTLAYDVLTAYDLADANQVIKVPGFLKFSSETGTVNDIFTSFSQTRIDPTTGGRTTGFSKFVAVDFGAYATSGTCGGDVGHQVLQPVNADGTSVFKQGRTVPVKFRVCAPGGTSSVGPTSSLPNVVTNFVLYQKILGGPTTVNETLVSTTSDTQFRWDATGQQWIFNLSTSGLQGGYTYVYRIYLNDGSYIPVQFTLR